MLIRIMKAVFIAILYLIEGILIKHEMRYSCRHSEMIMISHDVINKYHNEWGLISKWAFLSIIKSISIIMFKDNAYDHAFNKWLQLVYKNNVKNNVWKRYNEK